MADTVRHESLRVSAELEASGYADGASKVNEANKRMASSSKEADNAQASTQRTLGETGRAYTNLMKSVDPVFKAQYELERGQRVLSLAFERGKISSEQQAAGLAALQAKWGGLAPAIEKSRRGMELYGKSTELTKFQMLTLQYTFNDVVASLASGISPMTILMQQGGQVTQAFGGLGAALRALITPFNAFVVLSAGALAGLGMLLKSANDNDRTFRQLSATFEATGRAQALSRSQMQEYANAASSLSGASQAESAKAMLTLAQTRQIGTRMYADLIKAASGYAAVTGKDLPSAMGEFARGFASITRFASQMHDEFGVLTFAQYQHIDALVKAKKAGEAQEIVLKALVDRFGELRNKAITPFDKALSDMSSSWEEMKKGMADTAWIYNIIDALRQLVDYIRKTFFAGEIDKLNNELTKNMNWRGGMLRMMEDPTISSEAKGKISSLIDEANAKIKEINDRRREWGQAHGLGDTVKGIGAEGSGQTGEFEKEAEAAKKAMDEQDRAFKKLIEDNVQLAKSRYEARTALDSMVEGMKKEHIELTQSAEDAFVDQKLRQANLMLLKLTAEEQNKYRKIIEETARAEYKDIEAIKQHKQAQQELAEYVNSSAKKMSSALADAFTSGASAVDSFRDIAIKAINELIERFLYLNAIKPLFSSIGESGSSGSIFSTFSSMFFGGGNASGGTVYPGHAYTVGENGREAFVPSTSGQILPNSSLGGSVAQTFQINVNMGASSPQNTKDGAAIGSAVGLALKAKIIEIMEEQKRPGGILQGVA